MFVVSGGSCTFMSPTGSSTLVAQRLTRLAKLVGRERVMAGTDCGFAQEASTRRVPVWTQWAKLEALAEGARLASERLWSAPSAR